MRRDKSWWARLTKDERTYLVFLERADKEHIANDGYLPEGYAECTMCSMPTSGGGLCTHCLNQLIRLINKADGVDSTPIVLPWSQIEQPALTNTIGSQNT